ncbi:MAG TPA: insulinase family protein [Mucilaginibacter sp.]|jgi:zinc protease|nr:insulinase family protein [Mucilaginibacter sp.]
MRFKLTLTLLLLAVLTASAQEKSDSSAATQRNLQPMDKAIHYGVLPNGLTYYVRKNQSPKNRAVLYLVERTGSIQENDKQLGLAHFVEHMAFNGTRDFPKNQLVDYLQKSGVKFGADVNAHTGYEQTIYEITVPTDSMQVFNKGMDVLLNWAGYLSFDPVEVNNERNVILEEARLRGKNANERMSSQTIPVALNNSRYAARLPIGDENIIKNCTADELKQFYQDWYRPDNEAVIVVGDINPNKVEELIKKRFAVLQNPVNEKPLGNYSIPPISGTRIKIVTDEEAQYTTFSMTVRLPGTKERTNTEYLQKIRTILLNKMMNDRLKDIGKAGNPPFLFAAASNASSLGNTDVFSAQAVASPGNLEKATKAPLAELERARKYGFTDNELSAAKNWYQGIQAGLNLNIDSHKSEAYAQEYSRNFLNDEGCPGVEYEYNFSLAYLKYIQLMEINDLFASYISDDNRFIIIEAPAKDKAILPDEKTVLDWVGHPGADVQAYKDVNVDKYTDVLPEDGLKSGKIESDTYDSHIDTKTFILSNGAKVILKNTNFQTGLVLFNIYGFGGTSIAADADYASAVLSAAMVRKSGLANFNQVEFDKYLSLRKVSLAPFIHDYTQGITGSSAQSGLETALKLIHLYFTAPHKDTAVWNGLLSEQRGWLATKDNSPAGVFADTVSMVLNSNNPRAGGVNAEMLKTANVDKAFSFYKDRFADASNFTFVFVGNLDDIGVRNLIKTYIGSLPSTHSNETFKDLGMYPLPGKITKIVHKGIDDKSSVRLVFSGQFDYNQANNLQLNALGEILQIKLIERLRDQERSVYAVTAGAYYLNYPTGRYSLNVQFTCGEANVDKLIAATMEEIDKIRQNGALPADIEKFKSEEARLTQVKVKENGFWLEHLASTGRNHEDPDYISDFIKSLDDVTIESTKACANKYLTGDNLIKLILLHEKK